MSLAETSLYHILTEDTLVYRPNLKMKSDADILRDAKLEAMGLPPEEHDNRRPHHERSQMATDELVHIPIFHSYILNKLFISYQVMERFKKRMRK